MSTRKARTLKNSTYSVFERAQLRQAITLHGSERGMGAGNLLVDIRKLVPAGAHVFKDREQIREFINGSEPLDDKIGVLLAYLKLASPERYNMIFDADRVSLYGDVLLSMFSTISKISSYDRSILSSKSKNLEGVYLLCTKYRPYVLHTNDVSFLYLEHVENSPYLLCEIFTVAHDKSASNGEKIRTFRTLINRFFRARRITSKTRNSLFEFPTKFEDDYISELIILNSRINSSAIPDNKGLVTKILRDWTGFCLFDGDTGSLMLRDPHRRTPQTVSYYMDSNDLILKMPSSLNITPHESTDYDSVKAIKVICKSISDECRSKKWDI
ncbi:hypothetical protein WG908_04425 [Sphingobium sp. AN641]|uniref:hypothetical protein n=1 Tax=Sphingobium sp. AN641 TaxID=3133443 RepID=UPI0030BA4CC2